MNISISPNRSVIQGYTTPVLERSLLLNQNRRKIKNSTIWAAVNIGLISILVYDLSYASPYYLTYYHYVEYTLVFLMCMNVLYHFSRIIICSFRCEQIPVTGIQKKLLGVKDSDPNFKLISNIATPVSPQSSTSQAVTPNRFISSLNTTPGSAFGGTPMNTSALSWRTNTPNDSLNCSLSTSWTYQRGSPEFSRRNLVNSSPLVSSMYADSLDNDPIKNEASLTQYLKEQEEFEKVNKVNNQTQESTNLLSSFWSHPVAKSAKDMSSFLRRCQYQLSSHSPSRPSSGSPNAKPEESQMGQSPALEAWTRINVDVVALMQWNENLRKWISQTILERLVLEFDRINTALEKHGLNDIKIGAVGLDRLRKTSQMVPISHFIPSLATLIPFLEITNNQEYLEKRIRELSKGGCMSDFKWNGGSSHNGKEWHDSLPTDCAIIMHLLATYLDTQLMPLPSAPDTKPFSGHHYIKCTDKLPHLTPGSLFIHQVSEKPPHYRVIVGENVYEMGKGYNNLFHSILFFLYHVNIKEQGMLGRVNLGRAGVNMLWIIDQ